MVNHIESWQADAIFGKQKTNAASAPLNLRK
jgi:hypothetical protein